MKNIFGKWQVFEIPYEIRVDGWYTLAKCSSGLEERN